MASYRKDKNNIYITLNNSRGSYRFDIDTGIFYGIKGQPVKTLPRASEVKALFPYWRSDEGTNLGYLLRRCCFSYSTNVSTYARAVPYLQAADRVDAIGLPLLGLREEQYEYLGANIKSLVAYIKETGVDNFHFGTFKEWNEFAKVKNSLGAVAEQLTPEMYCCIKSHRENITLDELGVCAYYLVRGKYWEYHRHDVSRLCEYLAMCEMMEKKPEKVNNFMREYIETKTTYELRKTEFDNRKMASSFAKHSKAWDFSYGDFTIVIPTTGQDIVDEGDNMHHCVGGYVSRVVEGQTYICFVRKKDTPNECYLTCQVELNGTINQYYLAYDRNISTDADYAFKRAFQEHLYRVWNEG
jgi:hypothetical protein